MTIMWIEWAPNITSEVEKEKTIYDVEYNYKRGYEGGYAVLHGNSEVLGLKKGRYRIRNGGFD